MMKRKQRIHVRRSKKGKKFIAGKRKRIEPVQVSANVKRQIIQEHMNQISKDLKTKGRARLPELGILKIKIKKARPARWGVNPFTQERVKFKAKPRMRVVKFSAAKALKEAM